jgi:hypothetical protein
VKYSWAGRKTVNNQSINQSKVFSATAYYSLFLPITLCQCIVLPLPITFCQCLSLSATAYYVLPMPITFCRCLLLSANTSHTTCHCLQLVYFLLMTEESSVNNYFVHNFTIVLSVSQSCRDDRSTEYRFSGIIDSVALHIILHIQNIVIVFDNPNNEINYQRKRNAFCICIQLSFFFLSVIWIKK